MQKITRHGYERGKERLGFSKKTLDRMTERALEDGVAQKEAKGSLRRYLDALFLKYKMANVRLFSEHIFVFSKERRLITVFRVPNEHKAAANKILKRK